MRPTLPTPVWDDDNKLITNIKMELTTRPISENGHISANLFGHFPLSFGWLHTYILYAQRNRNVDHLWKNLSKAQQISLYR